MFENAVAADTFVEDRDVGGRRIIMQAKGEVVRPAMIRIFRSPCAVGN